MNERLPSPPAEFDFPSDLSAGSVRRIEQALDVFMSGEGLRSIAAETLTGPFWRDSFNDAVPHPAASLLKVPLVLTVYDVAQTKRFSMETLVRVSDLPPSSMPSLLDILDGSHLLSLRELCGLTLATSDNRLASYLLDLVGSAAVNRLLQQIGCSSTQFQVGFAERDLGTRSRTNVSTAGDMLRLMKHLYSESAYSKGVLKAMECVPRYSRISLRIPDAVAVARKSGSLFGVVNDTGIIRKGHMVLAVAILCDGQSDPSHTAIQIGDCVGSIWEELHRSPAL